MTYINEQLDSKLSVIQAQLEQDVSVDELMFMIQSLINFANETIAILKKHFGI
ncbi:hypothetical protein SAMD00019534_052620 [Acytostelium subglobosum LB1]|uniref:hypothetical protein n=1 Tax=Acytostelium subglobosum LB1 TaxID=1410327 RepID=UPI000644ABE0|nr:hypothetical protein SAMD00019534_052620 [Acytostelium subglobosum LB1]GAM22087.1 hypothetical protein SAMD00019534_052620 [Acytostelium subglobosum LB1]|eukprot:XP_012755187.1 hypothetical protein SAMD00019534_052620 [Acytostelium subglobosum LB1]